MSQEKEGQRRRWEIAEEEIPHTFDGRGEDSEAIHGTPSTSHCNDRSFATPTSLSKRQLRANGCPATASDETAALSSSKIFLFLRDASTSDRLLLCCFFAPSKPSFLVFCHEPDSIAFVFFGTTSFFPRFALRIVRSIRKRSTTRRARPRPSPCFLPLRCGSKRFLSSCSRRFLRTRNGSEEIGSSGSGFTERDRKEAQGSRAL